MSNRTVRASATALPKETLSDPVAEIGAKMAIATAARRRVDQACADAHAHEDEEAHRQLEQDRDAIDLYIGALQDVAMSQPAKSLAGAMLQAALLWHHMEGERDDETTERRCEFAVQSIIDILAHKSGVDPKALGVDYFAGVRAGMPARFEVALAAGLNRSTATSRGE